MWLGPAFNRGNAFFKVPKDNLRDYANGVYDAESGLVKFRNVGWYTNLDFQARHEELILYKNIMAMKRSTRNTTTTMPLM